MTEIDPVEFGRLSAQVDTLERQVTALQADVKTLLELANKGRGGLWMMNTTLVALGGLGAWLLEHLVRR